MTFIADAEKRDAYKKEDESVWKLFDEK